VLLTSRRSFAGLALLSTLVLGGCTDDPEETSGTQPVVGSRTPPPPITTPAMTTPSATKTTQPWERPPVFTDDKVRALYWKAVAGSCLQYIPLHKDQPIYYDPFPTLYLVPCTSASVTHKVVKRYNKYGTCPAGQAQYTLGHPAMSHVKVMTLCLRAIARR
jgi:hypothetical protein